MSTITGRLDLEKRLQNVESYPPFGTSIEVSFTGGVERRVYHGLGSVPNGWIVVQTDQEAVVYESDTSNSSRNEYLLMTHHASLDSEVVLWFF